MTAENSGIFNSQWPAQPQPNTSARQRQHLGLVGNAKLAQISGQVGGHPANVDLEFLAAEYHTFLSNLMIMLNQLFITFDIKTFILNRFVCCLVHGERFHSVGMDLR